MPALISFFVSGCSPSVFGIDKISKAIGKVIASGRTPGGNEPRLIFSPAASLSISPNCTYGP